MSLMQKWNELDNKKKVVIGVGSALAVTAAGVGIAVGTTATDQPAQTKVADGNEDNIKEKEENKQDLDKQPEESETAKVNDEKENDEDVKEDEVKKEKEDTEKKEAKKETKKETKKEEVKAKEKENNSSGNTPSATVKVEKKAEKTSASTESSKPKDTVTTKTTTATKTIKFKTVKKNDSSLEKGKTKVVQEGKNGKKTVTYKETYKNGKLISKEEISSEVTTKPVDKIVKVGTKEVKKEAKKEAPKSSKYLSASEAHSILAGSGMTKVSSSVYNLNIGSNTPVTVEVKGNHVTRITFNADQYIPWKVEKLSDLEAIIGDKAEAKKEYDWGKQQVKKIEKAVRAAANAVYGPGTSQANSLYNEIINSKGFARNF